ncbi:MAG: hypothetical protein HC875_16365 [Anaerolineales bacterium]|nr:hypothetical protein [Anaerolineales bacterium]
MPSPSFKRSFSPLSLTTSPAKRLALPRPGKLPTFDDLVNLVWVSILWEMPVGILCLTQESLDLWTGWLERFPAGLPALDVLDINQATLADWQAFLRDQSYDVTLLHGASAELQANRLSIPYVMALVNAAPDGVIVLA